LIVSKPDPEQLGCWEFAFGGVTSETAGGLDGRAVKGGAIFDSKIGSQAYYWIPSIFQRDHGLVVIFFETGSCSVLAGNS